MISCEIDLKLPGLNEYIRACRSNRYEAANFKRELEAQIALFIRHLPRFERPIRIRFVWVESTLRRDYDNIAFAKKFILDAMVQCGKLPDDNRRYVTGFEDRFMHGERTKVILQITENDIPG